MSAHETQAAADSAATAGAAAYPRRWLAAVVMIGAVLMDMIDITVVNVALPTIRSDLGVSGTQLEWVVSAYMLSFAAVLIIAGSFGDLFGRKRVFLVGIAGFGVARLVPETRDRPAGRPDVTGAVLLADALVAVAYPLLEGRSLGWPAWAWLLLAAGLVMLAGLGLVRSAASTPGSRRCCGPGCSG